MVPIGSVGYNVLAALSTGPMTFDALKAEVVRYFIYPDSPGLRRRLAKAVYEMQRHGYADRRRKHDATFYAKDRRWEITPSGRDALKASEARDPAKGAK